MLPHAYYSEIAQTVAGAVGFFFGLWAVWDAWKDGQFWKAVLIAEKQLGRAALSTEARYQIARVYMQSELATVVVYVIFLVIGVSGLFLPPPDWYDSALDRELIGIAISRYGMTGITFVLAAKTLIRRKGRVAYVRAQRAGDNPIPLVIIDSKPPTRWGSGERSGENG